MTAPVIWILGLPASGKTTLGRRLVQTLQKAGTRTTLLDSDEVRAAITPEPRYTDEERALFYRALAYTAARLAAQGVVVVVAATAHRQRYRDWAREICPDLRLVYAKCPVEVCRQRDPKDLYARAEKNDANTLPGVGEPFEAPLNPDAVVDTSGDIRQVELEMLLSHLLGADRLGADGSG